MTTSVSTGDAGVAGSTPPLPPPAPSALSPGEFARWAWRQLTSMRTALVLLFLLALAAVPGSLVPQANVDPNRVANWKSAHRSLTSLYDKLGLFDVYGSVWFSAVYILLMVSLVGCIVPRLRIYWRGMRALPPKTPRNLSRLPEWRTVEIDEDVDTVLSRAARVLKRRHYRIVSSATADGGEVSAQRGYLREAGNLLFHLSVLVVLVGFAVGQLYGYKGDVSVVVGDAFANTVSQYDDLSPGRLFDPNTLSPLRFTVNDFHVAYITSGPQIGQPESFAADLSYETRPGALVHKQRLEVNHPLKLPGVSVFLVGNGYAPVVTVKDGNGDVAYHGPVMFLPQDSSYRSFGVVKVPDAVPQQLGFQGLFLPTYGFTMKTGPYSQFPDTLAPVLSLIPYHGNLGLDDGKPQSVYTLNTAHLKTFKSTDPKRLGPVARIKLSEGQTVQLPNGLGSIRFDGVRRWVRLQVTNSPGKGLALVGVLLGIVGLMGSLFIHPRRTWIRVGRRDGRTVVELAALDRNSGGDLRNEIDELERLVRQPPDHREQQ